MGSMKLCEDKQAQTPFLLEGLGVSVYTMEELCYAIEANLFLLDEKWIGSALFRWIEEELGDAGLALHLKQTYRKTKDVYDCVELLLSASGFYDRERLRRMNEMLTRMRGKSSMERRKMKADYFLSEKKYRHAALAYLELLNPDQQLYMTEELQGSIMHNLGVVYARMFLFQEAAKMFAAAYRKNKSEASRYCYLYAMNYVPEEEAQEHLEADVHFATMKEAFSHFTEVSDQEAYYQERKKLSDASHSFNWRGKEEELRSQWLKEYNRMNS